MIMGPRARGEMDITTGFGPVIVGSSPAGRTNTRKFGICRISLFCTLRSHNKQIKACNPRQTLSNEVYAL